MNEKYRPGTWHMVWNGDIPAICDQEENQIASITEASRSKMLAHAGLIMAAPELYDAIDASLKVFRVMAEHGDENSALAAQDMIPVLQSALDGANFLGTITAEALCGA